MVLVGEEECGAPRIAYRSIEGGSVPPDVRGAAEAAFEACCEDLGIPRAASLRYFVPATREEVDAKGTGAADFDLFVAAPILGTYQRSENSVWISPAFGAEAAAKTVAHELRHVYQASAGMFPLDSAEAEADARRYALDAQRRLRLGAFRAKGRPHVAPRRLAT